MSRLLCPEVECHVHALTAFFTKYELSHFELAFQPASVRCPWIRTWKQAHRQHGWAKSAVSSLGKRRAKHAWRPMAHSWHEDPFRQASPTADLIHFEPRLQACA